MTEVVGFLTTVAFSCLCFAGGLGLGAVMTIKLAGGGLRRKLAKGICPICHRDLDWPRRYSDR